MYKEKYGINLLAKLKFIIIKELLHCNSCDNNINKIKKL